MADSEDLVNPPVLSDGNDGRLSEHNPLPFDIQDGICSAQIDCQIIGQPAKQEIKR
jgi:hypothetical protein